MHILITGGTGFIGTSLIAHLQDHQITVLTRHVKRAQKKLGIEHQYISSLNELDDFNHIDIVINLAGENIAGKLWTIQQKQRIKESRHKITEELVTKIKQSTNPPKLLISASAIGYYGNEHHEMVTEKTPAHAGFGYDICHPWEQTALACQSDKTRVCIPRIGIVLGTKGGMIEKILPVFKLGLGGRLGSGLQGFSWIHIDDMVHLLLWFITQESATGCYNATSPNPVSNKHFTEVFASTLRRPAFFHVPAWLLKAGLDELSELMLKGCKVLPERVVHEGFKFEYATLEVAMKNLLQKQ